MAIKYDLDNLQNLSSCLPKVASSAPAFFPFPVDRLKNKGSRYKTRVVLLVCQF